MKGLVNFGNTCYFNSAVQCLLQVPYITNYLILKKYSGDCDFTKALINVARGMWLGDKTGSITPTELFSIFTEKCPLFANREEHDSQEALLIMLDILKKSIPECIKNTFELELINEVVTPRGKTSNVMSTDVIVLSPPGDTIKDMLKNDEEWVTITDHAEHSLLVKRTKISPKLPKALILTSVNGVSNPEETFEIENVTYCLTAASLYYGNGTSGHYVCIGKHKNKWYLKDDTNVIQIETIPTHNKCYYVLIYKRVNAKVNHTIPVE